MMIGNDHPFVRVKNSSAHVTCELRWYRDNSSFWESFFIRRKDNDKHIRK